VANVASGNTYYVDTASSGSTNYLESKSVQVVGILFYGGTSADTVQISELSGQNTEGAQKLKIGAQAAHNTLYIDLVDAPIRFTNGIWIKQISATSSCTLVLKYN